jgi:hypothetical protein
MAGDWIPVRLDLQEDPAVIGIALAVKLDEFSVVGRLLRLWSWASSQTRDGCISFVTPEKVDQIVSRTGFCSAMHKVGWLRAIDGGGIEFPNYERWMGEAAKKRMDSILRKRASRSVLRVSDVTKNCDKSVTPISLSNCPLSSSEKGLGDAGEREGEKAVDFAAEVSRFVSVAAPAWFGQWAANHARRFSFRRPDDPETLAGWWLILFSIEPTQEELDKASLALAGSDKQPKGRPEHPNALKAIILGSRRRTLPRIHGPAKTDAEFEEIRRKLAQQREQRKTWGSQ